MKWKKQYFLHYGMGSVQLINKKMNFLGLRRREIKFGLKNDRKKNESEKIDPTHILGAYPNNDRAGNSN